MRLATKVATALIVGGFLGINAIIVLAMMNVRVEPIELAPELLVAKFVDPIVASAIAPLQAE